MRRAATGIGLVVVLAACSGGTPGRQAQSPPAEKEATAPQDGGSVWAPGPGTTWQWQLSGKLDPTVDADMYDVDLFDTPESTIEALHADGRVVICYFSAGTLEDWRPDAADYPKPVVGRAWPEWEGERWLDVRRLDELAPVLDARLDLAVRKGCDGVEPDNVQNFEEETGFDASASDQLRFNRWLAAEAHRRGLSIGLKNDLGQAGDLADDFDWALAEECFAEGSCSALTEFTDRDKAVFGVEYSGDPGQFCPEARRLHFSWLKKRVELDSWREAC